MPIGDMEFHDTLPRSIRQRISNSNFDFRSESFLRLREHLQLTDDEMFMIIEEYEAEARRHVAALWRMRKSTENAIKRPFHVDVIGLVEAYRAKQLEVPEASETGRV